jgi:4-methyl-5(b-hydroxyethyl)-thiazole monophosphate biosynthesis
LDNGCANQRKQEHNTCCQLPLFTLPKVSVTTTAPAVATDCCLRWLLLLSPQGGMPGAERLRDCKPLEDLMRKQRDAGKHYAAICATPAVFFTAKGLIEPGQAATAHPAFSDKLANQRWG